MEIKSLSTPIGNFNSFYVNSLLVKLNYIGQKPSSYMPDISLQKAINMFFSNKDLKQFPDNSFDFVILSQTLQAFLDPENVLNELLRIGKKAIVSIPNFGHWKVRLHLLLKGTMPVTENLPNEWYNTPNLHMCTIKDFENYCKQRNIKINLKNLKFQNLFSELGIFILEK